LLDYIPIALRSIEETAVLLGGRELAEPGPLDGIKETRTIDVIVIVISDITNRKVANQTRRGTRRYILARRDVE
jgi:F420-dependent methylenetetrahydromethanopterin dehydrogenase